MTYVPEEQHKWAWRRGKHNNATGRSIQSLALGHHPKGTSDAEAFQADDNTQWQTVLDPLNLDLYTPPAQRWWQRWLFGAPAQRQLNHSTRSLLIMQQPRWPLRHILLILRAEQNDWAAIPWIERLAHPGQTTVSLLPVVPAWPRLHRRLASAQPTADVLMAPNTVSGAMLRQMAARLRQQQIAAIPILTRGEPNARIRAAVAAHDPDLILIAAEPHSRLLRAFYGELVRPLVKWVERPLLIAK